jgi:hypothetical protein
MNGAVHRFHRRVRQKGHLIDGLDLCRGASHCLRGVAVLTRDDARLLRGGVQQPDDLGAGERGVRALVPVDVERRKSLLGRPHVVANDRHGVVEPHDLAHPGDLFRRTLVDILELAAGHRAGGDGGDQHARHRRVDTEAGFAPDLYRAVEPLDRFADQLELVRAL